MATAGVDAAEAGFGTSAAVAVGGEYGGEIAPHWDLDWVRVDLVANGVYALEVRALGAGAGSLVDPELAAVYIDPADDSTFSSYKAVDRVTSYGKVCSIGVSRDDAGTFPGPGGVSAATLGFDASDFDDGAGQDAWLLYRSEATASHYIVVASQGGFAGTYTVAATQLGMLVPLVAPRGGCVLPSETDTLGPPTIDEPGLVINPLSLPVNEGGTGSFTVSLATQPTAGVVVASVSRDSSVVEVSSGSSLPHEQVTPLQVPHRLSQRPSIPDSP